MDLAEAAKAAAAVVSDWPAQSTVRVIAHQDADGVAAAAIATKWLAQMKRKFHVTYTWNQDAEHLGTLMGPPDDAVILLDLGASDADRLPPRTTPALIVDHHPPATSIAAGWIHLNPWNAQQEGTHDACGSTTMWALAIATDSRNENLAAVALVGAVADRQDRPHFTGFNAAVLATAEKQGSVRRVRSLSLPEVPLAAIAATPPDALGAEAGWLLELGLPPQASISELDAEERQRVASAWVVQGLRAGRAPDEILGLFVARYIAPAWDGTPLATVAQWIDAAARLGNAGVAVAFLLGDPEAPSELGVLHRKWTTMVSKATAEFQANLDTSGAFTVGRISAPELVGVVATHAVEGLRMNDKPVLVVARADEFAAVSLRAPKSLGIDVGQAILRAARDCGGSGGGHPVAAGGRVPWPRLDELLERLRPLLEPQA